MTVPTTQLTISPIVYADSRGARRGRYSSPDGMKTPIEDLCWSTYDAGVLHFATHIPSRSTSSHHIPLLQLN
ncbi:hypothetical protein M404DRAFT_999635 [Pisolithus tinctorius Marx 270]|uniref:Uncharacterized protein n=1 Tax=Pisolithus tinctorius Marx 270 TaxID=870435 RepID=A0A0C3NYM8_PISTI|nr:hypothetical protein M404DRAFT_999635 [Pisolithus tinctorius Marx 270]